MVKTLADIKRAVQRKLKKKTINNLKNYIKKKNLSLWGESKDRLFVDKTFWIALYRLLYNEGYQKVLADVNFYRVSTDSFVHNVRELTHHFSDWSKKQVVKGSCSDWNKQVRNVSFKKAVKDANLWVDSSDFTRIGKKSVSKKSRYWSYKNNAPALRFTLIKDGRGWIRYLSEGYSPKIGDEELMLNKKEFIESKFKGAVFVGDCAYYHLKGKFSHVSIHAPVPKVFNVNEKEEEIEGKLTKSQKQYNDAIREIRGSVETPFGWMKETFESLKGPFRENPTFQENVVKFAAGVWNFQKN